VKVALISAHLLAINEVPLLKEAQGVVEGNEAKVATKAIEGCAYHEGPFVLANLPSIPKRVWALSRKLSIHGTGVSQLKQCLLDSHGLEMTWDWKFSKDGMLPERVMAKWFSPTGKEDAVFQMIMQVGLDMSKACVVFGGPYPITKKMKMLGPKSCIEMTLDLNGDAIEGGMTSGDMLLSPVTSVIEKKVGYVHQEKAPKGERLGEDLSPNSGLNDRIHVGEKLTEVMRKRGEPMVRLRELKGHPSQNVGADFMGNVPLSELLQIEASEVTQTAVADSMEITETSFVVNLEFALEIDMDDGDNKLTLILKGTLEPGRFILLGWMQYVWCNPFKLSKATCIANLELSIGVSPGVPYPTQAGGGGSFGIGKDCPFVMKKMFAGGKNGAVNGAVNSTCGNNEAGAACMQSDPEIANKQCNIATFYIGIDMLSIWDSYFSAAFTKLKLIEVIHWVSPSKLDALDTFLGQTGFPKGMSFSYATADIDIMAFTINSGISFAGTVNVMGWEAMCNFRFEEFPKLFTFEIALSPIKLGAFTGMYRTQKDYERDSDGEGGTIQGPYMNLVIQFVQFGYIWVIKEMPKVRIEGFMSIDGMCDAYARVDVNNLGMVTIFKGVMWKVFMIVQRQELVYPVPIHNMLSAKVQFELQLSTRSLGDIYKSLRRYFVRKGRWVMKRLKFMKAKLNKYMKLLGLTSSTLKEEMSLVYAGDEARRKLKRMRYKGRELGEAQRAEIPRCCEGTKEEMARLHRRMSAAGLGENEEWGSITDAAKAVADTTSDAAKATADVTVEAAKATADTATIAAEVTVNTASDVADGAAEAAAYLTNLKKVYEDTKTALTYLIRAVKGVPIFIHTIVTMGPAAVLWPCGASFGGELSGAKAEMAMRHQMLIWGEKTTITLAINFMHPVRSARKMYTLMKEIVLRAFANKKQGHDKCNFKIRGAKRFHKPKSLIKPNPKMPSVDNLKTTEKLKPKKQDWPPPTVDPITVVDVEEKAREKNQIRQDVEEDRKDQTRLEHDLMDQVAQKAKREEEHAKKQLVEAAISQKTLEKAKDAEVHGDTHPYETEVKEKQAIVVSAKKMNEIKVEANLDKIKVHVSPLVGANKEEQLMIHAFIAGYDAGDKDAGNKFGVDNAKNPDPSATLATVKDIQHTALLTAQDAFRAGYSARYAEVRNVARKVRRLFDKSQLSLRALGSVLAMDEEL